MVVVLGVSCSRGFRISIDVVLVIVVEVLVFIRRYRRDAFKGVRAVKSIHLSFLSI